MGRVYFSKKKLFRVSLLFQGDVTNKERFSLMTITVSIEKKRKKRKPGRRRKKKKARHRTLTEKRANGKRSQRR